MACRGCGRRGRQQHGPDPIRKVSVFGPGTDVKVKYLGDSKDLLDFEGPATRKVYTVGGRINLITVDSRDLTTGVSWALGLLQLADGNGVKLFEIHVPLEEEIEAEAEVEARKQEAWEAVEALALAPEKPVKSKRKAKAKVEPDGESPLPGD